MADEPRTPQPDNVVDTASQPPRKPKIPRREALNKLYALPAPIRTFPLPTLVPHNPLSLFHIAYVWLCQTIKPPSSQIDPLYQGWWSPETRSVHVTDSRSIRGLWEQGFYGKGILSRSEPDWMHKERARRGTKSKVTSEEIVRKRREERQQTKWERARKEREAIDQQLLEEANPVLVNGHANGDLTSTDEELLVDSDTSVSLSDASEAFNGSPKVFLSPVGPLQLLSLPNSPLDLHTSLKDSFCPPNGKINEPKYSGIISPVPVSPLQILAMPNSLPLLSTEIPPLTSEGHNTDTNGFVNGNAHANSNGILDSNGATTGLGINGHAFKPHINTITDITDESIDGSVHSDDSTQTVSFSPNGSALANGNGSPVSPKIKRQKNVRFSPTVEKNTFIQSEPPSPELSITVTTSVEVEEEPLKDQEHLQLTMEEAFFLSYSLGALSILDPATNKAIPNEKLFDLFRKSSHFPPLANPILSPDDPFMLNYVVYHHYRSLGWCVRGGAKFSVDFMLYNRGPVFSHAEFAIIILPSYSDEYWSSDVFLQNYVKKKEHRTWAWMHCINRVIAQVKKTLVLVYVDIPKPLEADSVKVIGIDGVLKRYQVREFVMKRWQVNRERGEGKK